MSNLQNLLEYISVSPTLLLFGAGPSCELGLPSWHLLAQRVYNGVTQDTKIQRVGAQIEKAIQNRQFPLVFDLISKAVGSDKLYSICRSILSDPGGNGDVYSALAQLPFCGYLTTNYDDIFLRHLASLNKAITVHKNSKSDLEQVDFDALPTLVKLHSDFEDSDTIILTQSQYEKVKNENVFLYFREFLKSHVLSRRVLIVGYSVSDPDISLILREATYILRREIPIYAIVANATREQVRKWELTYNIRIFPYRDIDGSHQELVRILNILVEYLMIETDRRKDVGEKELRAAQHLYMWHKVGFSNESNSINGAIDSLILGLVSESAGYSCTIEELISKADSFISKAQESEKKKIISQSIERLKSQGFLAYEGGQINLLPSGINIYKKNEGQFLRLCDVFKRQMALDFKNDCRDKPAQVAEKIADCALKAFVDLFKERAVELFSALFREEVVGVNPSFGIFRLLNQHAAIFDSLTERTWLIRYCTNVLKKPKPHEIELLSYLARAFFCFQVLELDPTAMAARTKFLSDRLCLVDSNVIIPTICQSGSIQNLHKQTFEKAQGLGITFFVLEETIGEIERAAIWALNLVGRHGEKSSEVLLAACGNAGYRPNQFLKSYIETAADKPGMRFSSYLKGIFSRLPDKDSIAELLSHDFSFHKVTPQDLIDFESEDVIEFRKKVRGEILRKAEETYHERSRARVEKEATVYTMIALWDKGKKEGISETRCCFVSLGGLLNWLAKSQEIGIEFSPVITLDGLYEVLRLVDQPNARMEFSEWMKQTYFAPSIALVTNRAAKKFFSGAIDNAEEIYLENLELFREHLDQKLAQNYIDEIPDFERPIFVTSLMAKVEEILEAKGATQAYYKGKLEEVKQSEKKAKAKEKYWRSRARLLEKDKRKKRR